LYSRAHGGKGAVALAQAVAEACKKPNNFKFLYPLNISIKEKIEVMISLIQQV
jgi:formyltetrahydrofolate synthetase